MPHRYFFWFILPALAAMVLFIALPIFSVAIQSLFVEHEQVMKEVENCGPFKCETVLQVDNETTARLQEEAPLGRFNGLGTYTNRAHLAFEEVGQIWAKTETWEDFVAGVYNLPLYKALFFTLSYTIVVTPLVLILGLFIALGVNRLPPITKGPTIFASLLPMIVTPLIGSLILFWMVDADGILGATLQVLFQDGDLSLKASAPLTWIMLFVYGVWHNTPFAFVVFYAGLQAVPHETLEAARIDGASRWQQVRYVVVPFMMPLVIFITLMQLMDGLRVFEPIVGFSASAKATSLSWIIFNDLFGDSKLYGSAAATSVITITAVCILLTPVLIRTWRDFHRKST
ncbi:MAG: sugar ABC transporter permease [Roseibium album]|uniref:Lactose transport system permease protein LacF n=1 Tax=Roseibium album TaxID=311410 RepID=A0A0M6ZZ18_9HYPH|nr:sugar ABC transporter permease [Roseibium album]MBG6142657.1 multiple sugar transport system permease protein [Labrenzia sp. EL_142]MBG6177668.1 multiple sugar transport system permease protein [Labrenzia sp. EL_132]MBG6207893.1 multiple sugar transport system permease protein [Labrenzia sp. EL_126]MBG6232252.1 multiple sugar transport system permease protein [Labrenzia sp. EL_208]MCR9057206.1 sugar ABC transporter permease [Paracoccaceae bacterium]